MLINIKNFLCAKCISMMTLNLLHRNKQKIKCKTAKLTILPKGRLKICSEFVRFLAEVKAILFLWEAQAKAF